MAPVSFSDISAGLKRLKLPEVDLVVGLATGGVVPAALVAHEVGCELEVVRFSFRDKDNNPLYETPRQMSDLQIPEGVRRILLVDDVSVTGETLTAAREALEGYEVITLVMKGRADYVVLPDVKTCVRWPWGV